jgi:hypothetical protein
MLSVEVFLASSELTADSTHRKPHSGAGRLFLFDQASVDIDPSY